MTVSAAQRDRLVAAEQARGPAVAAAAQVTAVSGPALNVSLDDAPPGTQGGQPDDLVVHQQDLQRWSTRCGPVARTR